ncbi:MAG: hypothetical protein ACRDNF_13770 [Streptosporangiaceae bacterium]
MTDDIWTPVLMAAEPATNLVAEVERIFADDLVGAGGLGVTQAAGCAL